MALLTQRGPASNAKFYKILPMGRLSYPYTLCFHTCRDLPVFRWLTCHLKFVFKD